MKALFTTLRILVIGVVLVIFLFPVYWTVTMAFKPSDEWTPTNGKTFWVPDQPTLDNFRRIFGGTPGGSDSFLVSTPINATGPIVNSLVTATFGSLLALFVGTFTAYGISRFRAGGKMLGFPILQLRMFPPIADDHPTALHLDIPASLGHEGGVDLDLRCRDVPVRRVADEAASSRRCRGRSARPRSWTAARSWGHSKSVLPQVKGGLAATALFVFILNWSDFLIALVLAGRQRASRRPCSSARSPPPQCRSGVRLPQPRSESILITAAVALSGLIQKYLVRGLTFGAIKR